MNIFEYLVGHWRLQPIQCTIPSCKDFKRRHEAQVLLQERKPGIQTEDICSTMWFFPQPFLHLTIIPSILCATAKRPIVWNFHQNSTGQMCQSQFVRSLGFGLINDLTIFLLSLNLEGPKKDCQDLKQANTFDVFFGKVHY